MLERIEAGRITETRLMEMVFPGQANHYGTLFGGQALALMDKAAFMVASRYARLPVVTVLDSAGRPTAVPDMKAAIGRMEVT